jgi:hypothetical protein
MAKVVGPAHSMFASGKLGPLVYSRNQFGMYARSFVEVEDPGSAAQELWRTAMSQCQSHWQSGSGMTSALRDMWGEFARNWPITDKMGGRKQITGRDWFVKFNIFRKMAGLGFHNAPPNYPSCTLNPSISLGQTTNGVYAIPNVALVNDQILYVSTVINQNVTRKFMPKTQKLAGIFTGYMDYPYLIIPNADLSVTLKRQFARVRFIDGAGRCSTPQVIYGDYQQMPPESIWPITANTRLVENTPDYNFSSDDFLDVNTHAVFGNTRSIVFSDFSSITPHAAPASAKLWLFCYGTSGSPSLSAYMILSENLITEATWNDRKSFTSWGTPGGLSGTDYSSSPDDTVPITTVSYWYNFDITSSVSSWLNESSPNYGIILINNTESSLASFRSANYSDPDFRPYIEITW